MNRKLPLLAYHASHEQFPPSQLLTLVRLAEEVGFTAVSSSDHFHPWTRQQGQSGYSFAFLGAALMATQLPMSVVCAPGQRYHPAIVAQAVATLCEMFPERFWVALGSGEAINEAITGTPWPPKPSRNQRLKESAEVIRRLWAGEKVSFKSDFIQVEKAKLYTLPPAPPLLFGAAVSEATAEWLGGWADGLLTIDRPLEELKKVVAAFRRGGGEGKPMVLKIQLSYADDEERALRGAFDQWKANIFSGDLLEDLSQPEQMEAAAQYIRPEDLKSMVRISADPQKHMKWIQDNINLGFQEIILHNVNKDQENFIKVFGEKVLPFLERPKKAYPSLPLRN